jgi:glycosyltransferase involved in cell wall biosynthesis
VKILVAAPDGLKTRSGGLRTQVERTVEEIKKLGHTVDFFNPNESYSLKHYDLAHIFSMNLPTYCKALAIRSYGLPLVFSSVMWRVGLHLTVRLTVELAKRSPHKILNDVIACEEMSHWAHRILPNTVAEKNWLQNAIGVDPKKCSVVPNGVDDIGESPPDEMRGVQLSEDLTGQDFVLCVAAVMTRKNVRLLARVCRECDYPLVLIGPQPDKALVESLIHDSKVHGGELHLLGHMAHDDPRLLYAYKNCRVFCLPSNYETPGIAAMEAALKGAPIVITEVGGTREYFGSQAGYIRPRSSHSLKNQLVKSWDIGRRVDTAEILRTRLLNDFSWASVAKKTVDQYGVLLNQL